MCILSSLNDTQYTPDCEPSPKSVSSRLARDLHDASTIHLVQGGSAEALGCLFQRYSRLVLKIATQIVRNPADAQDVLQDVFLYIRRRSFVFDARKGTVFSWVYQVTRSKAMNRRNRSIVTTTATTLSEGPELADFATSPEMVLSKISTRQVVRNALAALPESQRQTLVLHFFDGYTLREISAKRRESLGNTRHHYYRGIERLRTIVARECHPSP